MVRFERNMGGYHVLVDGKSFGCLQRDRGFFTSDETITEFVAVSSQDLIEIAKKAEEVKNGKD